MCADARTLPGTIPTVGFWDPLGFTDGQARPHKRWVHFSAPQLTRARMQSINEVKRLREAEVTHGRVAMSAAAGILLQEAWHPLFGDIQGPAIIHFQQVPAPWWQLLVLGIAAVEYARARVGWVEPARGLFRLREEYSPGAH